MIAVHRGSINAGPVHTITGTLYQEFHLCRQGIHFTKGFELLPGYSISRILAIRICNLIGPVFLQIDRDRIIQLIF